MEDVQFFRPIAIRRDTRHTYEYQDEETVMAKNLKQYTEERYRYDDEEFGKKKKREQHLKFYVLSHLKKWRIQSGTISDSLTNAQFSFVIFNLQNSLIDLLQFVDLFLTYGGCQVLIAYLIISIGMAIPLFTVFFFMGSFSKQKYIQMWSCVPILKGTYIPIIVVNLWSEVMNMTLSAIGIHLAFICLFHTKTTHCDFFGVDSTCIKVGEKFNVTCAEKNGEVYLKFSMLAYLESRLDGSKGAAFRINWNWIINSLVVWLGMLITTMWSKFITAYSCKFSMTIWFIALAPSVAVGILYGTTYRILPIWQGTLGTLLELRFWTKVMVLTLRRVFPGDLVSYSAMIGSDKIPTTAAFLAICARLFVVISLSNWIVISINILVKNYGVVDYSCIKLNGFTVIFAVIPDLFRRIYGSTLLLVIYYLVISFIGFNSAFYSINGLVEALFDNSPKMLQFKKTLLIVTVNMCFFGCLCSLNNRFITIYLYHTNMVLPQIIIIFCIAFFIFLYSPKRFLNDFHFTYGYTLSEYWKNILKCNVACIMCCNTGYLLFSFGRTDKAAVLFNLVAGWIALFPVVVQAVTNYVNYKNKVQVNLLKPEARWGPPPKKIRDDRRKFNPKRECRFLGRYVCNHECLQECSHLESEISHWQSRQDYFYKKYHIVKNVGISILMRWSRPGRHSAESVLLASRSKSKESSKEASKESQKKLIKLK